MWERDDEKQESFQYKKPSFSFLDHPCIETKIRHSYIWCNLFWTITRVKGNQGLDSQLLRSCHPSLHSISNWWETCQSTHTHCASISIPTSNSFCLPRWIEWIYFLFQKKISKSLVMEYPLKCSLLELFEKKLDTWGKMTILHHSHMGVGIYTFQISVKLGQLLHGRVQTPSPRASSISLENRNFHSHSCPEMTFWFWIVSKLYSFV